MRNHPEAAMAYKKESVLGVLDRLDPKTMLDVYIRGRGRTQMTAAELSRQTAQLKAHDIGVGAIERIEVTGVGVPPPHNVIDN